VTKAFVLMTALPPTLGHLDLIRFASFVGGGEVRVLVSTQPGEPFAQERYLAIESASRALPGHVVVLHQHETLPQEPDGHPGFWDMWRDFLYKYGFEEGDYIVASELYGAKLAEVARGIFIPYDLARDVRWTKGTEVRNDYFANWNQMIPEFRRNLQTRVTIFGAESTGKTTLARALHAAKPEFSTMTPEWARPYLEAVGAELTVAKMDAIHLGQKALQRSVWNAASAPLIIQDTDLFSTYGYWKNWDKWTVPSFLLSDAWEYRSDLYLITKSNIPFEPDILRYGGDKRELPDGYWIDMLDMYDLPYVVLQENSLEDRVQEALYAINGVVDYDALKYQRIGKEYAPAT
jgi:HTH-type transcriptional repressor of NAD biosynthesis genes